MSAARVERPATADERSRPPTPERGADPDAGGIEQAQHLLRPRARRRDQADRAGRERVREAEADSADHGGAAVRSHTSRPRSAATSLSRISCSTGTLSEKIITSQPASRASIASVNACCPGTEIRARAGPVARAADETVRGGCSANDPPVVRRPGREGVGDQLRPPADSAVSSSARMATSRSFGAGVRPAG